MRPTISNSSTFRLTSKRACRPPKRIDSSTASRTGIDALRSGATAGAQLEALALQPPSDRRGHGAEAFGLEDQGQDGEQPREGGDDEYGVVLEEADRPPPVGQVLAPEYVEQGEHDDPAPTAQAADDRDDEVR